MNSRTTEYFWKCYRDLPEKIKKEAKKAYIQFIDDPYYPGLHFKRIHSTKLVFSLRITKEYRALGIKQDENIVWFWIGSHTDYENLLKKQRPS
jgi:hypothetical protein